MASIEPATVLEESFRHSGWAADRKRIWESLGRCHERSIVAFANCGSGASVEVLVEPGQDVDFRLRGTCCHHRLCKPCSTARAAVIAGNLQSYIAESGRVEMSFLTLTLKVNSLSLREQLDRIYKCFGDLRRRKSWLSHVKGGAAFLEVKLGKNSGGWHVHLHIIIESDYWSQADISHEWYAVTGDSYITDISRLDDDGQKVRYAAKYGAKALDHSVIAIPDKLDEAVCSLKGRRVCFTFGTWRGLKLEERPTDDRCWKPLCRLDVLIQRAHGGEGTAHMILSYLRHEPTIPWCEPPPDDVIDPAQLNLL